MDRRRSGELAWYDWLAFLIWLVSTVFYLRFKGIIPSQAIGLPVVGGPFDVLPLIISGTLSIYGLWKRAKPLLWVGSVVALALMLVTPIPVSAEAPYSIYVSYNGKAIYNGTVGCDDLGIMLKVSPPKIVSFKVMVNGDNVNGSGPVEVITDEPMPLYKFEGVDSPISFEAEVSKYDERVIKENTQVLEGVINKTENRCNLRTHYRAYGPSLWDQLVKFYYRDAFTLILSTVVATLAAIAVQRLMGEKEGRR